MKKLLKTVNKLLFINFNRGGLILPLVLLILLFSSCGISIPAYLNPPIQLAELSFYHAYNNNPGNALGYEFFYRIYDEDTLNFSTVSNEAKSYFTETKLLGLISTGQILSLIMAISALIIIIVRKKKLRKRKKLFNRSLLLELK